MFVLLLDLHHLTTNERQKRGGSCEVKRALHVHKGTEQALHRGQKVRRASSGYLYSLADQFTDIKLEAMPGEVTSMSSMLDDKKLDFIIQQDGDLEVVYDIYYKSHYNFILSRVRPLLDYYNI